MSEQADPRKVLSACKQENFMPSCPVYPSGYGMMSSSGHVSWFREEGWTRDAQSEEDGLRYLHDISLWLTPRSDLACVRGGCFQHLAQGTAQDRGIPYISPPPRTTPLKNVYGPSIQPKSYCTGPEPGRARIALVTATATWHGRLCLY